MPRNQFQRTIFALLTVIVTVHAYVFFSLYVLHGDLYRIIRSFSGYNAIFSIKAFICLKVRPILHPSTETQSHHLQIFADYFSPDD